MNHFGGPFNAKFIIQRALCQSHVNGATTLKLYCYIGIGKYLEVYQNISVRGCLGGAGPFCVNLGPPIFSETTGARKLKLKTRGKVLTSGTNIFTTRWRLGGGAQGPLM